MSASRSFGGSPEKVITAVVANHSLMDCQLLVNTLRGYGVRVLSCTVNCTQLTSTIANDQPDIAIISTRLQDGPLAGLAALRSIRAGPRTRIIMLLDDENPDLVVEAFRNGARAIFSRNRPAAELRKCVDRVHKGQIWASNTQLEYLVHALMRAPVTRTTKPDQSRKLSKRETEIARLVAAGLSNAEVSNKLHLSKHTVKNNLFRIFEKLGISTRTELVLYILSQTKTPKREKEAESQWE